MTKARAINIKPPRAGRELLSIWAKTDRPTLCSINLAQFGVDPFLSGKARAATVDGPVIHAEERNGKGLDARYMNPIEGHCKPEHQVNDDVITCTALRDLH